MIETRELHWQEEELEEVIGKAEIGTRNAELKTRNSPTSDHQSPTTILISGELTLRDAEGVQVPTSLQQFNPVEIVGKADEWTRLRTVRLRAATLHDLQPLLSSFGSGHLILKFIYERNHEP